MRLFLTLLLLALSLRAELTTDQKLIDFQYLAALYNKHYAPDEWKLQLFNFNLFDLAPGLLASGSRKPTSNSTTFASTMSPVSTTATTPSPFLLISTPTSPSPRIFMKAKSS